MTRLRLARASLTPRPRTRPRTREHGLRTGTSRPRVRVASARAVDDDDDEMGDADANVRRRRRVRRPADSTDAIASFVTRRFGLGGGLAWLGVLAFGVASEQAKTRRETREASENTREVATEARRTTEVGSSGVTYVELTVGGGELVRERFLVAARVKATTARGGTAFDTNAVGREIVWSFGGKLGPPMCRGLEEGVRGMRQGGRRVVRVPAAAAFGAEGATFPRGGVVAPNEDVEFDITLTRVSIAPS